MRLILFLSLLGTLLFSSCGEFSSELYLNADGSGQTSLTYDGSDLIGLMGMMGSDTGGMGDDFKIGDVDIMKALTSPGAKVDTLISITSLMTMSDTSAFSSEEQFRAAVERSGRSYQPGDYQNLQAEMAKLSSSFTRLTLDADNEVMLLGTLEQFGKIEDLKESAAAMARISELTKDLMGEDAAKQGMAASMPGGSAQGSQLFMPKMYKGQVRIDLNTQSVKDMMSALSGAGEDAEGGEEESMFGGDLSTQLGLDNFKYTVHVPGKINTVTGAPYELTDENTVVFTLNFLEISESSKPITLNISYKSAKKYKETIALDRKA